MLAIQTCVLVCQSAALIRSKLMSTQPKKGGFVYEARPFVVAGIAACSASFVIHPIDLVKVRLQIVPPPVRMLMRCKPLCR